MTFVATTSRKGSSPSKGIHRRDRLGEKHGRLTVVGRESRQCGKRKRVFWRCDCDCGVQVEVVEDALRSGDTRSCGCLQREMAKARSKTHGLSKTKVHRAWSAMHTRCNNKNGEQWHNYGGRGIAVCAEWASFERFLVDMGHPPSGSHSVDRIDNDLGYQPGNCRWATSKEQGRNRRGLINVVLDGQSMCLTEACEKRNLKLHTVYTRMFRHNWPVEKALAVKPRPWSKRGLAK